MNGTSITILIVCIHLNQTAGSAGKNKGFVQPFDRRPVGLHDAVFTESILPLKGLDPIDHRLVGVGCEAVFRNAKMAAIPKCLFGVEGIVQVHVVFEADGPLQFKRS